MVWYGMVLGSEQDLVWSWDLSSMVLGSEQDLVWSWNSSRTWYGLGSRIWYGSPPCQEAQVFSGAGGASDLALYPAQILWLQDEIASSCHRSGISAVSWGRGQGNSLILPPVRHIGSELGERSGVVEINESYYGECVEGCYNT